MIDNVNKEFRFYDSKLTAKGKEYHKRIALWYEQYHELYSNEVFDIKKWTYTDIKKIPKQKNDTDCGIYVCMYADFEAGGIPIDEHTFDESHMKHFRFKITCDLLRRGVLY